MVNASHPSKCARHSEKTMATYDIAGKVQTVQGLIDPSDLGTTICHEHVFIDGTPLQVKPLTTSEEGMARQPVSLEILWWLRLYPHKNPDNMHLDDVDTAVYELMQYKMLGGDSLVDVTSIGLGRDPEGLYRVSRATGLNIIMGAGYYSELTFPPKIDRMSEEELAEEIMQDISEGVGNTGIKPGVIGELGSRDWPWPDSSRKGVRAAAMAQVRTGAPIIIHTPSHPDAPFVIVETLREAGADLAKTVMSHIDVVLPTFEEHKMLLDTGVNLQFDHFGREVSYSDVAPAQELPNDAQRIGYINRLVDEGYGRQILMSHDTPTKDRLTVWGGPGYGHILRSIVPRMKIKGIADEHIRAILVENPARILQFGKPA